MARYIDADVLISSIKRLENEYLYAESDKDKYDIVYGALIGIRQAITYTKMSPTVDAIQKSEWISVDNRLPEEDIRVLVYINSDRSYTKIDTDRLNNGKFVRWYEDVTHWMYLPEPPKV